MTVDLTKWIAGFSDKSRADESIGAEATQEFLESVAEVLSAPDLWRPLEAATRDDALVQMSIDTAIALSAASPESARAVEEALDFFIRSICSEEDFAPAGIYMLWENLVFPWPPDVRNVMIPFIAAGMRHQLSCGHPWCLKNALHGIEHGPEEAAAAGLSSAEGATKERLNGP